MRRSLGLIVMTAAIAVSGCSGKNGLRDLRAPGTGPDEFAILPSKPLTAPTDYQVLPAPTPGGANLTDPNPIEDAVVALGGRASALQGEGVPASDKALLAATGRYGVAPNTRQVLAQEDADFRIRQARLSGFKLFPVDRYQQAYSRDAIDAYDQAERFRRAGFETPSSPPADE